TGNIILSNKDEAINFIPRKNFTSVIEELMKSEALIVPGGGVFQSVTSCRSLLYYYLILWLARKFGTRIILPAQGLGPWKRRSLFSKIVHNKVGNELRNADYITVRDEDSFTKYKDITSPEAYVETTTDLVFLNDKFAKKKPKSKIDFMRVYAVLRTSVKGSTKIAKGLIKLANDNENIELVPLAFQQGEDSYVWRRAGWKGDIRIVDSFENLFNDADLVVSMRLHGCIMATKMGIPWIGIAYNPKVSSFAKSCDWTEFCRVPDEADEEFFEKCINVLAYQYAKSSKKLYDYAEKLRKVAEKDFQASCEAITKERK
ncbi:MAG: polysaccharide pyruvyl transferase family protein, partial [Candidatus Riflebacteria bacterium]|nr:polysaccharide pyruvyl transferase family protein [Candidatus Riflebacteria bacterium]